MNWYVLYTRPKYEKKISEEISRLNYENYLPLRTVFRKWSDRVKKIQEPLFPNYIFVRLPINEKHWILSVDGAVRLITFDGKPVPVRDTEIDRIKKIEVMGQDVALETVHRVGEKVRVTKGVFTGYEGELLRMPKGPRLVIKLPVLNQAVSVYISVHDVEKTA
jgi:transcription elongation factor/antiterminator RfaH